MTEEAWRCLLEERRLSPREVEVALAACGGATNVEIAKDLGRSVDVVKFHMKNAFRKLGICSRYELPWLLRNDSADQ